ncbi:MAG TPA: metal-dependent transcriptional regulator [Candidatus Hydrogenedentes bacterium]|nr:metal-dependent transcriptional regulator [Candidatus Hydrogenedentota bacterium]
MIKDERFSAWSNANDDGNGSDSNEDPIWRQYSRNFLSHSRAHYLMAIEALREDLGYARTTDVAELLEVSRGAASMALTQLKKRGWVTEDPNRFLLLTEEGKRISELVSGNFRVLSAFFETILGMKKERALLDACKIEHLISADACRRITALSELIQQDPAFLKKLRNAVESLPELKEDETDFSE